MQPRLLLRCSYHFAMMHQLQLDLKEGNKDTMDGRMFLFFSGGNCENAATISCFWIQPNAHKYSLIFRLYITAIFFSIDQIWIPISLFSKISSKTLSMKECLSPKILVTFFSYFVNLKIGKGQCLTST